MVATDTGRESTMQFKFVLKKSTFIGIKILSILMKQKYLPNVYLGDNFKTDTEMYANVFTRLENRNSRRLKACP